MERFTTFLKRLGIGLLMIVGGAVVAVYSLLFSLKFSTINLGYIIGIIGIIAGCIISVVGLLYARYHNFNRRIN